ncbi:MAG: SMC-Scp complex subunit ScpB [Chloroflexi bacterium]|nr:SMC-Scp complex subunit ScpB [Chloroflexota bacterium]
MALGTLSCWALLALASSDSAFRAHVAGRLSDPDRSRARSRLRERGILGWLPRLASRAYPRRFLTRSGSPADVLADERLVLGGASAAALHGWALPAGAWPAESYVAEVELAAIVERHGLERDDTGRLVLRAVPEPWPFPPQTAAVPLIVAALDLVESTSAPLAEVGRLRLQELAQGAVLDWRQRPRVRRAARVILPAGRTNGQDTPGRQGTDELGWDDRAERDATELVALLFVAGSPVRRATVAETLRVGSARLERACSLLRADPPRGLRLEEDGQNLALVSAPDCAAVVERHLGEPQTEALSQAALQVLAVIAYEQPVTRADITRIRGVDSDGVVSLLVGRGLVADERDFALRGVSLPLVTTARFLRQFGLGSLAELPPLGRFQARHASRQSDG